MILVFLLAGSAPALAQTEKLGVGDTVRIAVHQQPDLGTEARISERGTNAMPLGTIAMALVGEVKLAGLSPREAAEAIARSLKDGKYLKNPQVSVAISAVRSRQVSVLGEVARPGRYALDDTSSRLADVIAAAGGITATGDDTVTVLREGKEHKVRVLRQSFDLKGGETIHVERAPVFYIYGEVGRSGAYRVEPNMTVMQAIAAGGGISPRGSDRRLKLRRVAADGKVVETDAKLRDIVKPNDVIFVKEALF
jgi:polysaccharide export outer membrane protein